MSRLTITHNDLQSTEFNEEFEYLKRFEELNGSVAVSCAKHSNTGYETAYPFNEAVSDWQKGVRNHMRATKNHSKPLTIVNIYIRLGEDTINVKIKEKVN